MFKLLSVMKRSTRNSSKANNAAVEKVSVSNDADQSTIEAKTKVNLSKYKLAAKEKVNTKRLHVQLEYDEAVLDEPTSVEKSSSKLVEKTYSKNMPDDWEEVLKNLREMRKNHDAPVDTMGCDQCPDKQASPEDKRFQALISLMLSSQTKDEVNHAAMLRLKDNGCSVQGILNTPDQKLGELIHPVNFWKTKVKNIKRAAEIIRDSYNSDIPKTVEDLCKLPGVGPKMAHLCMKTAWGEISGIGVDTHVHRITNRLGWVKTKTPEATRKALEAWLPREYWSEVNLLLVGFGQQICQPLKPQCSTCLNREICPFGINEIKTVKKPKKK